MRNGRAIVLPTVRAVQVGGSNNRRIASVTKALK